MSKIVRKNLSDNRRPGGRNGRLEKLSQMPDREIDTSDIPELTEQFWQNAVRNPFYRPVKQQLTLRLDADIIVWLRRLGRGYQTRANALLREAMLRDLNLKSPNRPNGRKGHAPDRVRQGSVTSARRPG
jgi:uncharacterized protein (DUF4415 family)